MATRKLNQNRHHPLWCDTALCSSAFSEWMKCYECGKYISGVHYLPHDTHTKEIVCEDCWEGEAGLLWRLSL